MRQGNSGAAEGGLGPTCGYGQLEGGGCRSSREITTLAVRHTNGDETMRISSEWDEANAERRTREQMRRERLDKIEALSNRVRVMCEREGIDPHDLVVALRSAR